MPRGGTTPSVVGLRAEHVADGVVGVPRPRLSWQVVSGTDGWVQAAYQVRARWAGAGWLEAPPVPGAEQVLVPWPFAPLRSRDMVEVAVRATGPDGRSAWSPSLRLEAGLLERGDWEEVGIVRPPRDGDDRVACLRREFVVGEVVRARLYATAQGVYELFLNGVRVGQDRLAPGWTSYGQRLRYQVYDVTGLVRAGANALGARLADGWFAGRLGWWRGGLRHNWGDRTGIVVRLEVTAADGALAVVGSDDAWRAGHGGIVTSSFYDGETFDADDEPTGWDLPGYDDARWDPVEVEPLPAVRLVGPQFPAIRVVDTLPVRRWLTTPSGAPVADLGEVITGHVRLRLRGAPGSVVALRFAEVLDRGELALRPQRTAHNTDRVTLGASGELVWEPSFTFRSFRYVQLDDPAGVVVRDELVGRVVRNAVPRTGWFSCSDDELDRLHENAVRGIGDNMLDVPTDCMLRDERLGWIGDAAHYAPTAAALYDTSGLLDSWLEDLACDQRPNGSPTMVVPAVPLEPFPGDYPVAIFSDAACMAPATMAERFGDLDALARQLPSMAAWVRCVTGEVLAGFPTPGFQFGDWLDPTAPPDNPENGLTEYDVVMTLGAIRSARLAASAAASVGDEVVGQEMSALLGGLLAFFDARYTTPEGLVVSDSQTAYALALAVGALAEPKRGPALDRLVLLLRRRGKVQAGYPGTYALMDVLAEHGLAHLAYRLLGYDGIPGWRWALRRGATTFWERWDSLLADGSLNPGDMLSFNHPVFAGIADWLRRVLGGLAPAAPGYRVVRVAPLPGGGVTWAHVAQETPYGRVEVAWRLDDDAFRLDLVVPPGATAEVGLPGSGSVQHVGSGAHSFASPASQVPRDADTGPWGAHAHVAAERPAGG